MSATAPGRARGLLRAKRTPVKRSSKLFDGTGIVEQLQRSSFGKFKNALQGLQSEVPPRRRVNFKLPRVVVIGAKDAGKSSLLENITKCPVFPRKSGLCTKMPVRLQLTHVDTEAGSSVKISWGKVNKVLKSRDNILAEVQDIMDKVDTIQADELTIQICEVSTSARKSASASRCQLQRRCVSHLMDGVAT